MCLIVTSSINIDLYESEHLLQVNHHLRRNIWRIEQSEHSKKGRLIPDEGYSNSHFIYIIIRLSKLNIGHWYLSLQSSLVEVYFGLTLNFPDHLPHYFGLSNNHSTSFLSNFSWVFKTYIHISFLHSWTCAMWVYSFNVQLTELLDKAVHNPLFPKLLSKLLTESIKCNVITIKTCDG